METLTDIRLHQPPYYPTNEKEYEGVKKESLSIRVFTVALTFLALHKPFGRVITLATESIRSYSTYNELMNTKNIYNVIRALIAVTALAGTYFMHPLGLCISSTYDMGIDFYSFLACVYQSEYQQALSCLISSSHHLIYLGTMVVGSIEIIALSLLINMAIELIKSKKELNKQRWLEFSAYLLMSLVRFSQALPCIDKVAIKYNRGKQVTKNLKSTVNTIRDRAALYFFKSAHYCMSGLWTTTSLWINSIAYCRQTTTTLTKKVGSIFASSVFSLALLPFSVVGLAAAQLLHFTAFMLCTTPYIHLKGNKAPATNNPDNYSVFQLNGCLPSGGFARMFGGLVKPNGERASNFAKMVRDSHPNLAAFLEASDLLDSLAIYEELKGDFSDIYLNIGATPFVLQNNSGILMASDRPLENISVSSYSGIEGTEAWVNKCLFSFSTQFGHFMITHFSPSKDDLNPTQEEIGTRAKEQDIVLQEARRSHAQDNKPVYVLGDFNILWGSDEYRRSSLIANGHDAYNQHTDSRNATNATADTEYLVTHNWHGNTESLAQHLIIDYFLALFHTGQQISARRVPVFDVHRPLDADSDHHAIITEIFFNTNSFNARFACYKTNICVASLQFFNS